MMPLKMLSYSEFQGDPRYWELQPLEFGDLTLMVGKNATGKSRVLSVVLGLCQVLSSKRTNAFLTGTWHAEIEINADVYTFDLACADGIVHSERLEVNGVQRLSREVEGKGEIWFASENKSIAFQVPPGQIAICAKDDKLQHPFVSELSTWARGASFYAFGSELGKGDAVPFDVALAASEDSAAMADAKSVVETYIRAFKQFGEPFDQAVIRDMARVGYDLIDVSASPMQGTENLGHKAPVLLHVVEKDLGFRVPQIHLSQGMYRALALVVNLQAAAFAGHRRLLLVDDVGEGLDFDRASRLIELVVERARAMGVQAVLTSNDRLVMNTIPLEHWAVLTRDKSIVRAHTVKSSPKAFEEFRFMGLSNFDFFTGGHYQ